VVDEEVNLTIARDIMSAEEFLHANGIIHRDVKPSNIFLKQRRDRVHTLLGDFGLACLVNDTDNSGIPTLAADEYFGTQGTGTAIYAAPEQLRSQRYGTSVDIYAAGIVLYELFQDFHSSMERITEIKALRRNGKVSDEFKRRWRKMKSIVEQMVQLKPSLRPSASDVLKLLQNGGSMQLLPLNTDNLIEHARQLEEENSALRSEVALWKSKYEELQAKLQS
jgi:serine/threonine protein kinase